MVRSRNLGGFAVALALGTVLVACDDDHDEFNENSDNALTQAAEDVPVLGTFLANCNETGNIEILNFTDQGNNIAGFLVDATPANQLEVPTFSEFTESGDLQGLPIIGAFLPDTSDPSAFMFLSEEQAQDLFPGGIPEDAPILGQGQVSCLDAFETPPIVQDPESDPAQVIALIPVFGPLTDFDGQTDLERQFEGFLAVTDIQSDLAQNLQRPSFGSAPAAPQEFVDALTDLFEALGLSRD